MAAACALLLTACSPAPGDLERPVEGTTWTATDIYLSPGRPSALPSSSAGAVILVLGRSSATGNTGCAPMQAVTRLETERVVFEDVRYAGVSPDCPAAAREVHEQLTALIHSGTEFAVSRRGPSEIVLTAETDAVDRPSIRFLAL